MEIYCLNWIAHNESKVLSWICPRTWIMVLFHSICNHVCACFLLLLAGIWAEEAWKKTILICGRWGLFPQRQNIAANVVKAEWMRNEALYGLTIACLDFFFPSGRWSQTRFLSFAQRNFYSSCTSLHFTAVGSHGGPAAPIANLLMDLCIGFGIAWLLMHMMCSYMSQQAESHNTTKRFWMSWVQKANESRKWGWWWWFTTNFLNHRPHRGL